MNAAWHAKHIMPMRSTIAQRARWHVAHARHCGCREMPPTVRAYLAAQAAPKRRKPISVRGKGGVPQPGSK